MKAWEQDANEKIFYRVQIIGDEVASAAWTISPTGPTLDMAGIGSTWARIRVSGCILGTKYVLTCKLATTGEQTFERSAAIRCVDL